MGREHVLVGEIKQSQAGIRAHPVHQHLIFSDQYQARYVWSSGSSRSHL